MAALPMECAAWDMPPTRGLPEKMWAKSSVLPASSQASSRSSTRTASPVSRHVGLVVPLTASEGRSSPTAHAACERVLPVGGNSLGKRANKPS